MSRAKRAATDESTFMQDGTYYVVMSGWYVNDTKLSTFTEVGNLKTYLRNTKLHVCNYWI